MSNEPKAPMIRRTVFFSGRVQGVNFRATTASLAQRFEVSGYVRNLPDRRVEMVVEGEKAEVDRFQSEVERTMSGYIRGVDASDAEPTGKYEEFRITF